MRLKQLISSVAGLMIGVTAVAADISSLGEKSAIYVKREGQNKTAMKIIKANRKLCEDEKEMLLETRRTQPQTWAAILQGLKRDRPQYNVDTPLANEPDWKKVSVETEEEYFQGNYYAKYTISTSHKIVDDGSCKVEETVSRFADIDTGKKRYDLNLVNKTGEEFPSPLLIQQQSDSRIKAAMQRNPMLAEVLGDAMMKMGTPEATEKMQAITKVIGEDSVAGQRCEYKGVDGGSKQCYWKQMNSYPTPMERAIILKSVVTIGKDNNISEAVKFERSKGFDLKIFTVPSGVKLSSIN